MTVRILRGHVMDRLRELPDESVHTIVTSPPYWGLRDYKIAATVWDGARGCAHEWGEGLRVHKGGPHGEGVAVNGRAVLEAQSGTKDYIAGCFCQTCGAWKGQLGLEPTPELFITHLVDVFRELKRVLRADGTAWVNMGDAYCHGTGADRKPTTTAGGRVPSGWASRSQFERIRPVGDIKPKDLVGAPWMLAFALRADGWWLRQDIIWHKPNPMPESITDRCTKAHEYLFLLTRSQRYYYDAEAILEPVSLATHARLSQELEKQIGSARANGGTRPERPMKATARKSAEPGTGPKNNTSFNEALALQVHLRNKRSVWSVNTEAFPDAHFATFPTKLIEPCILAGAPPGGMVLDPFGGSGTTGLVADRLHRDAVLIELNPDYADMAERRMRGATRPLPFFAEVGT